MIKGAEDGEGETEDILGGCTLSGGCVHVLRSTLKAFLVKADGLRPARHVLKIGTRRGVELRCGRASRTRVDRQRPRALEGKKGLTTSGALEA
jgi:hypothetical protein